MKIYSEKGLRYFEFWGGAKDNAKELNCDQLDQLESILEDMYSDGIGETELNDLVWFEFDLIKGWLGINTEED